MCFVVYTKTCVSIISIDADDILRQIKNDYLRYGLIVMRTVTQIAMYTHMLIRCDMAKHLCAEWASQS